MNVVSMISSHRSVELSSSADSTFRELDALLRCAICFEYMNTTMLAQGCSHNYCSLCIRRYICYKQQCPTCLEPVVDSDLKNNRIVDQVLEIFRKCVSNQSSTGNATVSISSSDYTSSRVLPTTSSSCTIQSSYTNKSNSTSYSLFNIEKQSSKMLKNAPIETHVNLLDDDSSETVDGSPRPFTTRSTSNQQMNSTIEEKNSDENFDDDKYDTKNPKLILLSPPPVSRSTVLSPASASSNSPVMAATSSIHLLSSGARGNPSSIGHPPMGIGSRSNQTQSSGDTVPCPVCSVYVPARNINLHLDRCLSLDSRDANCIEIPSRSARRKPLPKLVYNLLSDKELRKKNAEAGLPMHGDRKLMIQRHREYTLIYNSECDSLNPKSGPDIVREILRSEGSKLLASASAPLPPTMSRVEKGASGEQVETARKSYIQEHKSQFAELIEAARRSRLAAKEKLAAKSEKLSSIAQLTDASLSIDSDSDDKSDNPVLAESHSFFSLETSVTKNKQVEMKASTSLGKCSSTSHNTLASDSESSNEADNQRLNPSGPTDKRLVNESSSELNVLINSVCESSSSLPPSQVTSFLKSSIGDNDNEVQPSPDLFGLYNNIEVFNVSPTVLSHSSETETKSSAKAGKQKPKQKPGRKKRSRASRDCNDSDDAWEPEISFDDRKKRKPKAGCSSLYENEEEDDLVCKVDSAAGGSGRKRLRSKPKRSCDNVNLVTDDVVIIDTNITCENPHRRQSTRARKVDKKK